MVTAEVNAAATIPTVRLNDLRSRRRWKEARGCWSLDPQQSLASARFLSRFRPRFPGLPLDFLEPAGRFSGIFSGIKGRDAKIAFALSAEAGSRRDHDLYIP